jgi:hypothetical protein
VLQLLLPLLTLPLLTFLLPLVLLRLLLPPPPLCGCRTFKST